MPIWNIYPIQQNKFYRRSKKKRHCLLCLDYDGTLTPIVERPELAILPKAVKEAIETLNRSPFFKLAIISGRSLSDIQRFIGIQNIFYVGNHGLEIFHSDGKIVSLVPLESKRALERVLHELQGQIDALNGVFLENKGAILAFHYRQASLSDRVALRCILFDAEKRHSHALEMAYGKKVLEIRPRCNVNKGTAVNHLREQVGMGSFPIFIGDDTTDADAFRVIKGEGLAIQVGQAELHTMGDYYLRDPDEVMRFLQELLKNFGLNG